MAESHALPTSLLLFALRLQLKRSGVHAITHPRRPRPIRKDMAQMRIAAGAAYFCPCHSVRAICVLGDHALGHWLVETRPAGPGVKLGVCAEQRLSAAHAGVRARVFGLVIFPGESGFGAGLAGYVKLLGREFFLPFFF